MTTHVVYTAWGDSRTRPLYVGCTQDLKHRMSTHRCKSKWVGECKRIDQTEPMPRIEALALERRLIWFDRPKYNRQWRRYCPDPQQLSAMTVIVMFRIPTTGYVERLASLGLLPIAGPKIDEWQQWTYDYDDAEAAWIAHRYAVTEIKQAAA